MFLQVAIDAPLRQLFEYLPPNGVAVDALRPGQRLWLPFGRRRVVGVLVALTSRPRIAADKLRRALSTIESEPVLDESLLAFLKWSADYYHHPIGEVLAAALPPQLRAGASLHAEDEVWKLTECGRVEALSQTSKRATRLRGLVAALKETGEWVESGRLQAVHPQWRQALKSLEKRGYVERQTRIVSSLFTSSPPQQSDRPALSAEQAAALQVIVDAAGQFRTLLLQGVTGSGKTEVYLRAIEAIVARGEQALVLAPEISLTPQLVARFRARFSQPIAVMHSSLSDHERLAAWRAARSGEAAIVIGTRSAIFAPLPRLGLLIVDEEHDASYKQQEGFRYSARDLAIVRAQRHRIPVVLGSATPSLESIERAERNPQNFLSLPKRAGAAQPPQLSLIDLRKHASQQGLSTPAMLAIRRHLDAGGQVLLYLNRRGYAPVLFCPGCGWAAACERCDARLTVHRSRNLLICHHCGLEAGIPAQCPNCLLPTKPVGQGTERIAETVAQLYPDAPLARIDRDSVSRRGELAAALERIGSGEAKILVGTQMLSKGHDFPNVTLAVILNADQGLFGADFRASERLAQNIVQVAGRAGRGARPGEVLIQTEFPEHPLLQQLLKGGGQAYGSFATAALKERQAANWPPYTRLALLRAEASQPHAAQQFLSAVRDFALREARKVQIFGPAPAPMGRRAGLHRSQLLLQAATPGPLQSLLTNLVPELDRLPAAKRVRWSIDVDPVELF